ncbi:transmembrane protein 177 [Achroia grisella]|uniref:transmembrane protein 177 n=1 Tax=Achroia grisella TaxID=688607 RepID=UPI0027D2CB38|nr:transmembrane protein 177 [Achroia grisella]
MVTKRSISWFLTDSGRKFSYAVVTGTGIALTTAKFAPHTFLLDKYKDFVHYYSNGQPVELPKNLCDQYQKCLDVLKVPDIHRKYLSPFSVFGYDLFHAGSTSSKFGGAIGIPVNFSYKSLVDLENHGIEVNLKKVDWSSETGKKLADALILPDKVKEFAICREILMTQNKKVFYESAYPFTCVFFVYNLAQYICRKYNFYAAPTIIRATLYSILGVFGLGSYFLMKDVTEVYYETEVDKKLCELGPEFIESGVTFYNKLLQRNQALRELMGKEGENKYSKLGNENFGIRQPRLALVHRKQFFEERLCEYKEIENTKQE